MISTVRMPVSSISSRSAAVGRIFAGVDAALGHLPPLAAALVLAGGVGAAPDPHEPARVDHRDADAGAVAGAGETGSWRVPGARCGVSETKMGAEAAPIYSLGATQTARSAGEALVLRLFLGVGRGRRRSSAAPGCVAPAVLPSVAVPRRNDSAYCSCVSFSGSLGT